MANFKRYCIYRYFHRIHNRSNESSKAMSQRLTSTEIEFNDIEDGKRVTIRKGYRSIKLGSLIFESLKKKRTITVQVVHIIHSLVQNIPSEYVRNDGFTDKHDLVNQL